MAEGEEEDTGISRCGISGYFDEAGNPAALASGWMDVVDSKKRKSPQFFVMTPVNLAFFRREEHALVSDTGFMTGDADHDTLSFWKNHGASIRLIHMQSVTPDPDTRQITIQMRPECTLPDGSSSLILECANAEITAGWAEALAGQIGRAGSIYAPVRQGKAPDLDEGDGGGARILSAIGSMFTMGGGGGGGAPTLTDDEYFSYTPWEDMDVDLMDPRSEGYLYEYETGAPAAVLHGWLTKLNKSGVRAGSKDSGKDRYFVLTPDSIVFFPDVSSARVERGYMRGTAEGERISGVFSKVGGRLPLESIAEIRPGREGVTTLQRAAEEAHTHSADSDDEGGAAAASAAAAGASDTTNEDEAARPGSRKPRTRDPWFEIDFNEFVLTVNAHNLKNRNMWIRRLRAWTAWRKQQVDREMLTQMGGDRF